MLLTPREHQLKFLDRFFKTKSHGMCAVHPTGSGKTFLFILVAEEYLRRNPEGKVIFCSPKTLLANMIKEIDKIGGVKDINKYKFITIDKFVNEYKKSKLANITINDESDEECVEEIVDDSSTDIFSNNGENLSSTLLMIDEAHNLKTEIKIKKDKIKTGGKAYAFIKASEKVDRVMMATATPLVNYIYDINNLVTIMTKPSLRPENLISPKDFMNIIYSKRDRAIDLIGGKFDFYQLSKEDREEYPTTSYRNEYIIMSGDLLKWYKIQESYHGKVKDISDEDFFGKKLNMFFTGIRMASNIDTNGIEYSLIESKVKKIRDIISEYVVDGKLTRRFIIYSQYVKWGVDIIRKALEEDNIESSVIVGLSTEEQRKEATKMYNDGLVDILVISKCGREGIDTKNTDFVIIMENSWNISTENQVVGRAVRRGSHSNYDRKHVEVIRLLMIKPQDFYDGPEMIIEYPGNKTERGELKSADLLLMGISKRKVKVLTNIRETMLMYNEEMDRSEEQMSILETNIQESLNKTVLNIHNAKPLLYSVIGTEGLDDILLSVTSSMPYYIEFPIIDFDCKPTSLKIDGIINGKWKDGKYLISLNLNLGNYTQFSLFSIRDGIDRVITNKNLFNRDTSTLLYKKLRMLGPTIIMKLKNYSKFSTFLTKVRSLIDKDIAVSYILSICRENNQYTLSNWKVNVNKDEVKFISNDEWGQRVFIKKDDLIIPKYVGELDRIRDITEDELYIGNIKVDPDDFFTTIPKNSLLQ